MAQKTKIDQFPGEAGFRHRLFGGRSNEQFWTDWNQKSSWKFLKKT